MATAEKQVVPYFLIGQHPVNPDVTDKGTRVRIINEIRSAENLARKRFEQRKFDVYRKRQAPYIIERLMDEFSSQTVQRMRKVLSINPCKRIVDQMGSIYSQEPDRHFSNTAGADKTESDKELEQNLEKVYHLCGVDPQMRLANRYFKLNDQSCLYVCPKGGYIQPRAITPKDYDVIPDADDPEMAYCYVLNVFNVNLYGPRQISTKEDPNRYYSNTRRAETISNDSDRSRKLERYIFWTDEITFTVNGYGDFVDEGPVEKNPIGRLPFIDIAQEKDYQFFVRRGNDIVEFTIDLLMQLTDLAEITRLQGYSQAIIYSTEQPKDLVVGPNKVMWIKQPADGQHSQPKFAFESPKPDLTASLDIISAQLKMFLSSQGLDVSTITGDTAKARFTSGIDHLLANIDKFQASQEDFDLFRRVETELWDVMRLWLNAYQDVTGDGELDEDLKIGQIDEEIEISVQFVEPQLVQTQKDKEDSVIKRWDNNLLTTKDAVMELYDFDDDKALEYIKELQEDVKTFARPAIPGLGQPGAETAQKPGAPGADGKPAPDGKAPPGQDGKDGQVGQDGKKPPKESKPGPDQKTPEKA